MITKELFEKGSNTLLVVSAADLKEFAADVIAKAIEEWEKAKQEREADERLLSSREVMEMCGISSTTLWRWEKSAYLPAVKVGNSTRFRQSDVKRVMGVNNE